MTQNIYAVILAAGESRRMGEPKQLLRWKNRTLLEHAIVNVKSIFSERVIVVLGANAPEIQSKIDFESVTLAFNSHWQEGIASSIRLGITSLPVSAEGVLILLGDQPLIHPSQLQLLLSQWQKHPTHIVASEYAQSVGVPAVFSSNYFSHLLTLKGEQGAKVLLRKFESNVVKVPLPEAECDIDVKSDFQQLLTLS
jgi:molybdenum cofactor cytidylyltransferase